MEGTVDVRAEEMEMADDGQGQGAWKKVAMVFHKELF